MRAGRMFSVPAVSLRRGDNEVVLTFSGSGLRSALLDASVELYPPALAARLDAVAGRVLAQPVPDLSPVIVP